MELTYRNLIRPLPARHNLANAAHAPALNPCAACKSIVPDRTKVNRDTIATGYELIDTYPVFPLLKTSADAGCGSCWIIRSEIRKNWAIRPMEEWGAGPLSEDDPSFADLLETPWNGKVRIFNLKFKFDRLLEALGESEATQMGGMITSMTLKFGPLMPEVGGDGSSLHGDISQIIRFKAFDSVDIDSNGETSRRRLPSQETLSGENVDMMHSWISRCKSSHEPCRLPSGTDAWLPTRLLDVGSYAESRPPCVVETKKLSADNVRYAALSHMWGDVEAAPPLQTMKFNYDSLKREIPFRKLPRNFADAAEICQRLGIKYLWIDSLCIIQDSKEDWGRESQMMHKVYKDAEVSIVATSATSSHDGFLDRDLSVIPAVKIQYGPVDKNRFLILTPTDDTQKGVRSGDIDGSKWNTRGWTMQERALSTRSIHFCRNKIYFECRGCLTSEENEPEQNQSLLRFHLWPRTSDTASQDLKALYSLWRSAVTGYSRRKLTVGSDKLTAIQSIASEMQSQSSHPEDYHPTAGMWLDDFPNQLLWYVESGIPRRVPNRAPSWSWASLDANIGFLKGSRLGDCHAPVLKIIRRSSWFSDPTLGIHSHQLCNVLGCDSPVAEMQRVDDHNWNRASFPYDILGPDGQIFAHGMLDLDNRDDVLRSNRIFSYLHVSNEQHPSGLLLAKQPVDHWNSVRKRTPYAAGVTFPERVGVATIFHTSGEMIKSDLFRVGKDENIQVQASSMFVIS